MIYRTDAEEHVSLLPCPTNSGTDNNVYLTKLQPTKKSTPNNRLLLEDIFDSLLHITAAPFPHGRKLLEHTPIRLHPPVAMKGVQILASTRLLREVRDGFSLEGNLNKMVPSFLHDGCFF